MSKICAYRIYDPEGKSTERRPRKSFGAQLPARPGCLPVQKSGHPHSRITSALHPGNLGKLKRTASGGYRDFSRNCPPLPRLAACPPWRTASAVRLVLPSANLTNSRPVGKGFRQIYLRHFSSARISLTALPSYQTGSHQCKGAGKIYNTGLRSLPFKPFYIVDYR